MNAAKSEEDLFVEVNSANHHKALDRYRVARRIYNYALRAVEKAQDLATINCEHLPEFSAVYPWSRSDGYGNWRKDDLPWCMICNKVLKWGVWTEIPKRDDND